MIVRWINYLTLYIQHILRDFVDWHIIWKLHSGYHPFFLLRRATVDKSFHLHFLSNLYLSVFVQMNFLVWLIDVSIHMYKLSFEGLNPLLGLILVPYSSRRRLQLGECSPHSLVPCSTHSVNRSSIFCYSAVINIFLQATRYLMCLATILLLLSNIHWSWVHLATIW